MRTAVPIHLNGLKWSEFRQVVACIVRVLVDSTRTVDIMVAEELTSQAQLRYLLSHHMMPDADWKGLFGGQPCFSEICMDDLMSHPAHTLGGALARFHRSNSLSPSIYHHPTPFTADPEAAYLMQRIRQCHDVWHVLTGLGVQGHEEILLHAFSLAQTGLPSSVALMLLGSIKHMLLEGRLRTFRRGIREAYDVGRRCESLLAVHWERHFTDSVESIRKRYGVRTLSHYS